MFLRGFILLVAPFLITAVAGDRSSLRRAHSPQKHHRRNSNTTRTFKLVDLYQGQDFLDQWNFFTAPDPTHGLVNFQSRDDAIKKKLAFVDLDGSTVLAVDDFSNVSVGGNRDSVRINTKKTYNHGLFIADFAAMPHGCSLWPAYWSVGPNWPTAGEIDILEGVHEGPTNQYVLHTSPDCRINNTFSRTQVSTNLIHDICTSSGNDNRGCGFSDPDVNSYGHTFNLGNGGVFAHLWDSTGIRIWRFVRDAIPADIQLKQPNPYSESWGTPVALFEDTQSCDIASHFFDHTLVLDTTICGDFAGPTYQSAGCPGTCQAAVANATNFKFAKWRINYIAVYDG